MMQLRTEPASPHLQSFHVADSVAGSQAHADADT